MRDSNPRMPAYDADAVATEPIRHERYLVGAAGIEPAQAYLDAADLQSVELNQCSAPPENVAGRLGLEPR